MADYPSVTYTNLKHKVANGVSGGVVQVKDETINVVFACDIGLLQNYRASYNSPYNEITGTLNSDRELSKFEVRVTPVEVNEYGPDIGNRAYIDTSIAANTNKNFTIPITQAIFAGSPSKAYRICLLAQSSLDYSWDCTQLFVTVDDSVSLYQEVEYVQATGTQYFDTGFVDTPTTRVVMDIQFTSTTPTQQRLFGHGYDSDTGTNVTFDAYINGGGAWARGTKDGAGNWQSTGVTADTNRHTFDLDLVSNTYKIYTNGSLVHSSANAATITRTNTDTLTLLSRNNGTSEKARAKLYGCKIYNSGVLVRDFIPVKRNADSVYGIYDKITHTFCANIGTGTFSIGSNTYSLGEYQQVEYVANSDGNQYIDTGYVPNYSNGFAVYIKFAPTVSGKRYCLLSNYNSGTAQLSLELNTANKVRLWANTGGCDIATSNTFTINDLNEVWFNWFDGNKYSVTLNNVVTYGTYSTTPAASTTSMYLFLDRALRASTFSSPIKIYEVKIYSGSTLVRHLLPCYRRSDSAIGFCDVANSNTFYPKAGSGSFTKGNDNRYNKFVPSGSDGYDVHWGN